MEDITIAYHVPRKRDLLINQIIKIIKQESWISHPSKYVVVEYVDTQMGSRQVDDQKHSVGHLWVRLPPM